MKESIYTDRAPAAIGAYSQAIKVGNTVYLSGQIPLCPQQGVLCSEDFTAQAIQVFKNLQAVAEAAGADLNAIAKLTIYLTDLSVFSALNAVMATFFKEPYPARATVQVAALPREAQIEIDAILILG